PLRPPFPPPDRVARLLRARPPRDFVRAVVRAVVHDQDRANVPQRRSDDRADMIGLVVGGDERGDLMMNRRKRRYADRSGHALAIPSSVDIKIDSAAAPIDSSEASHDR